MRWQKVLGGWQTVQRGYRMYGFLYTHTHTHARKFIYIFIHFYFFIYIAGSLFWAATQRSCWLNCYTFHGKSGKSVRVCVSGCVCGAWESELTYPPHNPPTPADCSVSVRCLNLWGLFMENVAAMGRWATRFKRTPKWSHKNQLRARPAGWMGKVCSVQNFKSRGWTKKGSRNKNIG